MPPKLKEPSDYDEWGSIEQEFEVGAVSGFEDFMHDVQSYIERKANEVERPCRIEIEFGINSLRDTDEEQG